MSPVRLAFVGVGGMGQCAHLVNYAAVPDCQVVAIAELREQLAQKVAARYAVPKVYKDFREMLSKEQVDGIVHINQFGFHGQMVPELAKFGKPILTEKPLANSVETGRKILAALQASGVTHYLAYHKRSDPATMHVRALMNQWQASGELGALRYIRIAMPPGDWVANGFVNLLKTDEKCPPMPSDACPASLDTPHFKHFVHLVNYYIHQVNLMRHLLGDYHVISADRNGVVMLLRGDNGVTATIEMGTHSTSIDWQESAFVAFERGWIRLELPAPLAVNRPGRVVIYRDPKGGQPQTVIPEMPWVHAMRQQALNFVAALRGEQTPLCTAPDALKDLEVMKEYLEAYVKAGGALPKT